MQSVISRVPCSVQMSQSVDRSWQAVGDVLAGVLSQIQETTVRASERHGERAPYSPDRAGREEEMSWTENRP